MPKRKRVEIEKPKAQYRLLLKKIAQLVQVCANKEQFLVGKQMQTLAIMKEAYVVVDLEGKIAFIGNEEEFKASIYNTTSYELEINCQRKSVVPGFVDAHTHPVWSGDRVHEFSMKLAGATYMDIHKAGGGIGFSVAHTKASSEKGLSESLELRLQRMISFGTTTVEAKSGYGLDPDTEMKLLRVLTSVGEKMKDSIELSNTFLGAHSVPKTTNVKDYTNQILTQQIPQLIKEREAGKIKVENIDVFYEKGIFEREDTTAILNAGKKIGLSINFHGDELNPMHSGVFGAEIGARAISHLEKVDDEDIKAMAANKISAVLLPTTAYILRIENPPARKMISEGVIVALGTDYNPNAHCLSMPMAMNLSCIRMNMSMSEALIASTINSAYSLGRSESHGSIEVGKFGDFVIVDDQNWEHLIYEIADPPIEYVFKKGLLSFNNPSKKPNYEL